MKRWREVLAVEKHLLELQEDSYSSDHESNLEGSINNSIQEEDVNVTLVNDNSLPLNDEIMHNDFSSSDESSYNAIHSDEEVSDTFTNNLAHWVCVNGIKRNAVNQLLKILRDNGHPDLPLDSRTLLRTPREIVCESKCGGSYAYLGIQNGLSRLLYNKELPSSNLELLVNCDGLPLFKSSNLQLWPILCKLHDSHPFVVCCFSGSSKPNNVSEFLADFLNEYKELRHSGMEYNENRYTVKIKAVICDAPARQLLKGIKSHTGYFACERCQVQGERTEQRTTFHDLNAPPRTDAEFDQMLYQDHQIDSTPLINSSISCIADFPLDYMHLVCLGVMKRLLMFLKEGPRICKMSSRQVNIMSGCLTNFNGGIPSELARQPKSVDELKRWKATEFRQFLLYTGMVVFQQVFTKSQYKHFLAFSVSMRILLDSDKNFRSSNLNYAKNLLIYFVKKSPDFYGKTFTTYNVHSWIHLHEDVGHFGVNLDQISCFPFENYLQILKKNVRNANNAISQIVKRTSEFDKACPDKSHDETRTKLTNSRKDCWFILENGDIALIESCIGGGQYQCGIIRGYLKESYFVEPCCSKLANIYFVRRKNLVMKRNYMHRTCLKRKVVCLPTEQGHVFVALLHDINGIFTDS